MGMYCTVVGTQTKMTGLLAKAVVEQAKAHPNVLHGVELEDGSIYGGILSLDEEAVKLVCLAMRKHILRGWANGCNGFSKCSGDGTPLMSVQDIAHFAGDVQAFEKLAWWIACPHARDDGDKLVWA